MELSVQHVGFAFHPGQPVLADVSFTVGADAVVYILGHNGCGKSTLFNCLAGIYTPQAGQILLDGQDIARWPHRRRARWIGLVPQNHAAAFPYSVREMVLMGRAPHLGAFDTPGRDDYRRAEEALAAVGLTELVDRSYNELSGGERRLVMVARGLAQDSDLLLLDEPDAYLDPRNQHIVQETIVRLARRGRSFIVTSHAPNSALLYADRVILMKGGRLLADGAPEVVLTEGRLTEAYNMPVEVLYDTAGGRRRPRAILPQRAPGGALRGEAGDGLSPGGLAALPDPCWSKEDAAG
jgi:iron complex transport system ATP-binding protein